MTQSSVPTDPKKQKQDPHPGMMGDGTEEQNLNQTGNPDARVSKEDADAAFGGKHPPGKAK